MAFQPGNPDVVYAALWQTAGRRGTSIRPRAGPAAASTNPTDGGRTWVQLQGHGLPTGAGRIGIALSAAATEPGLRADRCETGRRAVPLRGRGRELEASQQRRAHLERGWYFSGITVDPKNPDIIYVCDTIVLRSTDGGAHFIPLKGDPTGDDFHTLWIDPNDPQRRILGVDQGTLVSR